MVISNWVQDGITPSSQIAQATCSLLMLQTSACGQAPFYCCDMRQSPYQVDSIMPFPMSPLSCLIWSLACCSFASDQDGKRRTVRLEMLSQHRMDGHLTGVTVIRAKLAQLQCDALLLTFRQVTRILLHALPPYKHTVSRVILIKGLTGSRHLQMLECCMMVALQMLQCNLDGSPKPSAVPDVPARQRAFAAIDNGHQPQNSPPSTEKPISGEKLWYNVSSSLRWDHLYEFSMRRCLRRMHEWPSCVC